MTGQELTGRKATAPDRIESLELVLTSGCNLRCAYCYQNDKKTRSMSWDTLRGALDLLLRSRCQEVEVLFLGGEPLLEFPLICKAVTYVERTRPPKKTVRYALITNGTLLGDRQARFLARHGISVQLSFDGVAAAQCLRGRGTFVVLERLLDVLQAEEPRLYREQLSVSVTLTAATIPHLADSVAYLLGKRVPEVALAPVMTHDPDWTHDMMDALDDQLDKVFKACLRHHGHTGEVPLLLFRRSGAAERHRRPAGAICRAASGETLAVDVDGQVHGCAVFIESYQRFPSPFLRDRVAALRLGDYRAPEFAQRLAAYPRAAHRTGLFHDKRGKYSSFGRCGECRFVEACSICPASIGHIPGNTDPSRIPDFACAFNRVALTWRERFPVQVGNS